ncbi:MAG: 3'-5' exonuclease domain-containing protein 2 [Cyclobacteriaceae bacterium]|nr:3'-5' exonuclease domain-containing protein 2 [Cyclobacteriaceae bacterium SS2]
MFPDQIEKSDLQQLPLIRFEGEIHVIEKPDDLDNALDIIGREPILGFDTETKPTFTKGAYNHTALIQFATLDHAFLLRINRFGIPDRLKKILENENIRKIGISLRDDLKDLKKVRPFKPAGFIDLNNIAKDLGINQIGIKSLTGIFLERRVAKNQQTSNWENQKLTTAQKRYAATDAWVCMKMYDSLMQRGFVKAS